MRDGENQTLNMSLSRKCFSADHLPSPTRRPVRNRRSGHPSERWFLKEHEQERTRCGKYTENSRQHDCESVVCYSFLSHIQNNGFKGFLSITNQPCRIIEIDFKGSRSAVNLVVFCFDFTNSLINSPIFVTINS